MPSRRKKALRDSKVTNEFFDQGDIAICPCCNGRNQNHAMQSMKPGDSDNNNLAETNIGDETAASVLSFWRENYQNLKPEERQKWQSFIDIQETIPDLEGMKRALRLAHKQMSDISATADQFPPMATFDLGNLKKVAKIHDEHCRKYKDEEERGMADLAERVGDLAVTASDVKLSSDDHLAAELDIHNLNIHSKIIVPLTSCLRQIQLFNIDKKFGCVEESYQALDYNDRKRRGEDVPTELPLSFRQKWNNPSKLMESASKPSKKENKKKLGFDDALAKFQRNVQLMTEDFQRLKKAVSDAGKPVELPSLPSSFTYAGVPVPDDIPDHIRQRFFDAAFALQEVLVLLEEAYEQRRHVQVTLTTWYAASHEAWESGKRRIHEMPRFREYEYTRTSLHAMYRVSSWQEVKIVEFYSSEGAPKLSQAMKEALGLGSLCLEEFDQRWEMRCLEAQERFPSVDQMMSEIEEFLKKLAEQRKQLVGVTQ